MGTVGFSRDLNETWSMLFDGGVRRTWSEVETTDCVPLGSDPLPCVVVRKRLNNENWAWVAGVSLQYRGEYFNGSLSYNRDFAAASGLGGAADRNSFTLSTQYRLTYELSAVLTTGYYMYHSDRGEASAVKIDQDNFFILPGVRYDFSKDMFVEASYGYTRVRSGSSCINPDTGVRTECSSSSLADRHVASIRFYIQHPFLEWL
jgi:long-subunit fatty acid transport protein